MKTTVEISLYPLNNNYEKIVLDFIKKLHKNKKLTIETNGLSTQIFGEYEEVMKILTKEIFDLFQKNKAIFVLKIGKGELRYNK
jgi:uncharacterized protein YqgV (UPF0045/DUF77 family)